MKVLYCIDSIGRGGTELQLMGLIGRLDRQRFAPHLCTLRPSDGSIREVECPHLELNTPKLLSLKGLSSSRLLASYLHSERIEIVQTFFQDSTMLGVAAARAAGVPVRLISFRDLGFWRTPSQQFWMRRAYPMATGFVANSRAVKEHVCAVDGLDATRVHVIHNGIDLARYPFVDQSDAQVAVGIVGNLNRRVKRTDLFLRAAALVHQRHPEVSWHVIGDGSLRPEYEHLAAELGIRERAVFAGRIDDVPAYLQKLTIGVNCSDSEGFSNAVLEYMLSGCAVIATAVGGNLEAVRDGENGLLVPPGSPSALAEAFNRLIEDKVRRVMLVRRARDEAEKHFGWGRCVMEHQDLYQSLLGTGRGGRE